MPGRSVAAKATPDRRRQGPLDHVDGTSLYVDAMGRESVGRRNERNVLNMIEKIIAALRKKTAWGDAATRRAILKRARKLRGDITVDGIGIVPLITKPKQDPECPKNRKLKAKDPLAVAMYELTTNNPLWIPSEEIYVFLKFNRKRAVRGDEEIFELEKENVVWDLQGDNALAVHPVPKCGCAYKGYAYLSTCDLADSIVHEPVHAHYQTEYNVNGNSSQEEEQYATKLGRAAAEALGCKVKPDASLPNYNWLESNPEFTPIGK